MFQDLIRCSENAPQKIQSELKAALDKILDILQASNDSLALLGLRGYPVSAVVCPLLSLTPQHPLGDIERQRKAVTTGLRICVCTLLYCICGMWEWLCI